MCVTRRRWGCQFAMLNARLRCDHARLACSRAAADAPDPDDLDFDFGSAADYASFRPVPLPSSVGVLLASAGESDAA